MTLTDEAERAIRDFTAALPLDTPASSGYIGAHCAERYLLEPAHVSVEPLEKDLSPDGETAIYVHVITNPDALAYRPSSVTSIGWPARFELNGTTLRIALPAATNPPPKKRHEDIMTVLTRNLETLNREIAGHNSRVRAAIERYAHDHHTRCAIREKRRADL